MGTGRVLTDAQIESYLNEKKTISTSRFKAIRWKEKEGHRQKNMDLDQTHPDYSFQIFERQSRYNQLDFSVGIYLKFATSNEKIILLRCNGNSHDHPNRLEGQMINRKFHIHKATQRYMKRGIDKPESFAEETTEYSDIGGAFEYLCRESNIRIGDKSNTRLDENAWE